MSDKKDPVSNPLHLLWHGCLVVLGCVLVLNVAVTLLQPILPWIIGGVSIAFVLWVVIAIIRWRRSRW